MKITEEQREMLERTLDQLHAATYLVDTSERVRARMRLDPLYRKAVSIVRERPAGARKLRSDAGSPRPTPQEEMEV